MTLPTSRDVTCTAATKVSSALLNKLEDCIIGGRHGSITRVIPASAFRPAILLGSQWAAGDVPESGGSICGWADNPSLNALVAPLVMPVASVVTAILWRFNKNGTAAALMMALVERVANADTTISTVSDVTSVGTLANGTIQCIAKAAMADTDYMTISDGVTTKLYEFDTVGNGVTAGRVQVNISSDTSPADVAARLRTAILAAQPLLNVVNGGGGVLTVTREVRATSDITMTENVAGGGFTAVVTPGTNGWTTAAAADLGAGHAYAAHAGLFLKVTPGSTNHQFSHVEITHQF